MPTRIDAPRGGWARTQNAPGEDPGRLVERHPGAWRAYRRMIGQRQGYASANRLGQCGDFLACRLVHLRTAARETAPAWAPPGWQNFLSEEVRRVVATERMARQTEGFLSAADPDDEDSAAHQLVLASQALLRDVLAHLHASADEVSVPIKVCDTACHQIYVGLRRLTAHDNSRVLVRIDDTRHWGAALMPHDRRYQRRTVFCIKSAALQQLLQAVQSHEQFTAALQQAHRDSSTCGCVVPHALAPPPARVQKLTADNCVVKNHNLGIQARIDRMLHDGGMVQCAPRYRVGHALWQRMKAFERDRAGRAERRAMVARLKGVSVTALCSLHDRACEGRRADGILTDKLAMQMQEAIDFPFTEMFGVGKAFASRRAATVDREISTWLAHHPGGQVVSLGEGLETQFFRVDEGTVTWVAVDLPGVAALAQQLTPYHPRRCYLAADIRDLTWVKHVDVARPVMVTALGVLGYMEPFAAEDLVNAIVTRLPDAHFVFDGAPVIYDWAYRATYGWTTLASCLTGRRVPGLLRIWGLSSKNRDHLAVRVSKTHDVSYVAPVAGRRTSGWHWRHVRQWLPDWISWLGFNDAPHPLNNFRFSVLVARPRSQPPLLGATDGAGRVRP